MVSTSTLLSDTILFVRNTLRTNVTDPLLSTRPSTEKWVMTSYPRRAVSYPNITVKGVNLSDVPLGQQSEQRRVEFEIEVRIWARNEKEKNNLFDSVYTHMRTNQFTGAGTSYNANLYDFDLLSAVEVDEEGEQGIKSRVCMYKYNFIT